MVSKYLLLAVIFSGLVTWIPRVIPFILVKYKGLPAIIERFLKFLPVSIIFALILSSVATGKVGDLDRKSTRLNSSHIQKSRMPSSA